MGRPVGMLVGLLDGSLVDGTAVPTIGWDVGIELGALEGNAEGLRLVGEVVGAILGVLDGEREGSEVLGCAVGH